jgi:ABC-type polysaccharide/polyol phosphate export permease
MEYTTALQSLQEDAMTDPNDDDGSPKFGRLLIVLILAVLFCIGLTWVMGTIFPNFPNFK